MNRGTWWTTVHWVTKSRTQLSDFYFLTWSLYNVTYQFYLHKIKRKNILKLKWTNKKYKLSSFEKLKENKAYITTQFTLRCNCPQRLLFKSLIGYSLLPFAPQSGCLCVWWCSILHPHSHPTSEQVLESRAGCSPFCEPPSMLSCAEMGGAPSQGCRFSFPLWVWEMGRVWLLSRWSSVIPSDPPLKGVSGLPWWSNG